MSFADYIDSIGGKQIQIAGPLEYIGSGGPFDSVRYTPPSLGYGATNIPRPPSPNYNKGYQTTGWVDAGGGFLGYGGSVGALQNVPQLSIGYGDYLQTSGVAKEHRQQIEAQQQQALIAQAQERQLSRQQYANSLPTFSPIQQAPVNINSGWGQPGQQNYTQPAQGGMLAGLHRGSSGGAGMLSGGLHRGGNQ